MRKLKHISALFIALSVTMMFWHDLVPHHHHNSYCITMPDGSHSHFGLEDSHHSHNHKQIGCENNICTIAHNDFGSFEHNDVADFAKQKSVQINSDILLAVIQIFNVVSIDYEPEKEYVIDYNISVPQEYIQSSRSLRAPPVS